RVEVSQLVELPIGLSERLLRHVLGILPMAQHAVGHAKRQGGRVGQPELELAAEVFNVRHEPPGQAGGVFMHPSSPYKTVLRRSRLEVLDPGGQGFRSPSTGSCQRPPRISTSAASGPQVPASYGRIGTIAASPAPRTGSTTRQASSTAS